MGEDLFLKAIVCSEYLTSLTILYRDMEIQPKFRCLALEKNTKAQDLLFPNLNTKSTLLLFISNNKPLFNLYPVGFDSFRSGDSIPSGSS